MVSEPVKDPEVEIPVKLLPVVADPFMVNPPIVLLLIVMFPVELEANPIPVMRPPFAEVVTAIELMVLLLADTNPDETYIPVNTPGSEDVVAADVRLMFETVLPVIVFAVVVELLEAIPTKAVLTPDNV